MNRLWKAIRRSQEEDDEEMMAKNVVVAAVIVEVANQPQRHGSRPGHALNAERLLKERGKDMLQEYFVEYPVFNQAEFRTRYRMSLDRCIIVRIFISISLHFCC